MANALLLNKLTLRPASQNDFYPLCALADDYKHLVLDDYDVFDTSVVERIISGCCLVFDSGYQEGAIWFDNVVDDLRADVHILVRPQYLRQIIKQSLIPQAFDLAFEVLKVGKILAYPMHTQKTALKLLRRYKFYEHKPWTKHTRVNGLKTDVIMFELRRSYWRKERNGIT